jgi:hypothetical protein
MEAPWVLVHLLRQTIVFLKERALRRAMESPRHYELWPRRTRTSSAFRAPGSQRMSSSRSRSSVSMIPRSTSYPLLLQFRQHRDASLQSLRNMTHRNLLQAGARLPNSDETAEFVTPIERARSWEGREQELELGVATRSWTPAAGNNSGGGTARVLGTGDWWLPSYFWAINFRCHASPTEVDGPRTRGVIPYTGCSPRRLPRNA